MNPRTNKISSANPQIRNVMQNPAIKRANSATTDRMSLRSMENRRSNSARIPRQEPPPEIEIEEPIEESFTEDHKVGCPWKKARSQSRNRLSNQGSITGLVHPKPWGARNPNDIPCFCKTGGKNDFDMARRQSRSPTRMQDLMSRHEKQASKQKVSEVIAALCSVLERKKIKISEFEFQLFFEMLKEKLQKYKETSSHVEQQKQTKQVQPRPEKSPMRRPRMVQSLTPTPQSGQQMMSVDLGDQARTGPMLGQLETKKYFVELRSEDQVPQGLKHMLGMMNPHSPGKQCVVMDGGLNYVPVDDMRQYTVMNTGVEVRHREENTMVLLGNQGMPNRPKIPTSAAMMLLSPSMTNAKPRRV